ncbi:hypothetical protein BDF14DRAFT_1803313 [Spinellus fusiger]|nr:hypothetical protein BDF14DRAFT_1803313 [Spinellus fusiger]
MDFFCDLSTSPTSLLLRDLINAPSKAEHILDQLTSDQILMIESTINRVKKRKHNVQTYEPHGENTPPTFSIKSKLKVQDLVHSTTKGQDTNIAATTIANALAKALTMANFNTLPPIPIETQASPTPLVETTSSNDPVAEIRDGIEWVSFVYSHNRILKRYTIRTDIHTISLDKIDEQFKSDNCVYPRANLPKELYKGNRWCYETECNTLGWKLAWLNTADISGKRGLIQRAVDSYRNRYPSMRSRRVARQEKLMNGTLRKRKHREEQDDTLSDLSISLSQTSSPSNLSSPEDFILACSPCFSETSTAKATHQPKSLFIDDFASNTRFRIKINIESVQLDEISQFFRTSNCPFPRAMVATPDQYTGSRSRWLEESTCNELGWKLAWLNPRLLAGKKNLLQRALDIYCTKFMPSLLPRRHSPRTAPIAPLPLYSHPWFNSSALSVQNARFAQQDVVPSSPAMSCMSGTTASLDFGDCFSLEEESSFITTQSPSDTSVEPDLFSCYSPAAHGDIIPDTEPFVGTSSNDQLSSCDETSCYTFYSSANSAACTPSPPVSSSVFGCCDTNDFYDSFMLPPVNDTFLMLDMATTHHLDTKFSNPFSSPSLPSSAVQQDLDMSESLQAEFLLDPLF